MRLELRLLTLAIGAVLLVGVVDAFAATQRADVHRGPGLTIGFSGAPELTSGSSSASATQWGQRAASLGTQVIRMGISWSSVAPSRRPAGFNPSNPDSPGYNWSSTDQQVEQLTAEHFRVLVTVNDAPRWAEGPRRPSWAPTGSWEPSAGDFGSFATAAARRYDGHTPEPGHPGQFLPRVSLWQAWNEPNLDLYLSPQWLKNSDGGFVETAPRIYRGLLNAFYRSVKAVSGSNFVLTAGTAPYGDPTGGARMGPVTFDQYLFCLSTSDHVVGCSDPAHFDAIDHHPYGVEGPTWHAFNSYDAAVPDIYKLTRVLAIAERAHTVKPAGHKGVWVTEVSWNTSPPEANGKGVPAGKAARWLEQTFYVLWRQGVNHVLWYQLADSGPGGYNSGVYFKSGKAKPGTTAFRFPFLTTRRSSSTVIAWGRSPAAGELVIERQNRHGWVVLSHFTVDKDEVFQLPLNLRDSANLRAVLGRSVSLTWSQGS
jgi:hypothetical protein